MDIFAHRGFADAYPENTLTAFQGSVRRIDRDPVLTGIEFDVRQCGSGEPVVVHDAQLDRLTDLTGPVDEYTAAELQTVSVEGSDAHIPTLDDALARIPPRIPLQIELKEQGLASDVLAAVADRPAVRLTSFDPAVIREVRATDPACPLGYLFDGDPAAELAVARDHACTSVHPRQTQCLDTDIVATAHAHDLTVIAWGVDTPAAVQELAAHDVDGCTADHWELAAPLRTDP